VIAELLSDRIWVGLALVTVLYLLDYRLSVIGHRWFKRGADRHYDMGGSYELNPPFIEDIEAERPVSVRHLIALARIWLIVSLAWWFTVRAGRLEGLYLGVVGFFVLTQLPVHMRHVQNIVLFRFVALKGGVEGRAQAARWLDLKVSAAILWYFAAAYVLLWVLTGEYLFVGGAVGTALAGARFWIFGGEAESDTSG